MLFKCQICLSKFKDPKFRSSRITICGRCANDLNSYREPAETAYNIAREWLRRGILRRLITSTTTPLEQERTLQRLEKEVDRALPEWINKLAADKSKKTKTHKIIRAHRRGLLFMSSHGQQVHPKDWDSVAKNIRKLYKCTCVACSARDCELRVHHILYGSNFGTNQRHNLITLCRQCHENEHERVFDFGESISEREPPLVPDPNLPDPIDPNSDDNPTGSGPAQDGRSRSIALDIDATSGSPRAFDKTTSCQSSLPNTTAPIYVKNMRPNPITKRLYIKIIIGVALSYAAFSGFSTYHEKKQQEARDQQQRNIRSAVENFVATDSADDSWEQTLAAGNRTRFSPVRTVELQKIWLTNTPILFIGELEDIYKAPDGSSRIKLNHGLSSGTIFLGLACNADALDEITSKAAGDKGGGSPGIAVTTQIKQVEYTPIRDSDGTIIPGHTGYGDCINIIYLGTTRLKHRQ